MKTIVGRTAEIKAIRKHHESPQSEFVVIYGRRRVGKTFLVKSIYSEEYAFQATGLSRGNTPLQINNFHNALCHYDPKQKEEPTPKNWMDAFNGLKKCLERSTDKKKVVFIDELPWMDTPRSNFLMALEHFWNGWAALRNDIYLIVCGSVTSWMINKIINNHGGLHNRVTGRIHLKPFDLKETKAYLEHKGAQYDHHQLLQLYMTMGGIPFYLDQINPKKSIAQNIDQQFFVEGSLLRTEFHNLYASLFKNAKKHIAIIRALAEKSKGLTKAEIIKLTKLKAGGSLTLLLEELMQCGFIKEYLPFGKKKKGALYQLIDFYSLFYLKFIEGSKTNGLGAWMTLIDHPKWRAWSGYAFENICFSHESYLKKGLGIGQVYTEISSWRNEEAQIDLVIDRRDRVINLCEIKFSQNEYVITKDYAEKLTKKTQAFRNSTKTRKTLFLTFITLYGLKENKHSINQVQNQLKVDELFFD